MSMPIYGDMKDVTFQNRPFYPVVESPGVVFIVKKEDSSNAAQAVMEAVFQGWPVLLLTLIMAALSGIVVWALVSKRTLETSCFVLLVFPVKLDGVIWSNSVTLSCATSVTIVRYFLGNNKWNMPQSIFYPNFRPHCHCHSSFFHWFVPYIFLSSIIHWVFGCFFRILTGTQKNFLVPSSREHGKASGGPSFPWLLLGKGMI